MVDLTAPFRLKTVRDYSLAGPENAHAVESGLANALWYQTPVDRKVMKELMKRSDGPALRNTALWLSLLLGFGGLGIATWGTWWAVPVFVIYGVLYGSAADARWHEMGHGTAFKTGWMNDWVYEFASFLMMRNSVVWRWSHARHHTDTIIVGRDPEVGLMRPPQLILLVLNTIGVMSVPTSLQTLGRHAMGRLSADERDYVPVSEQPKAIRVARVHMAIYGATLLACILMGSFLPALLIGLPRGYGVWLLVFYGLPQHAGLAEDVLDHRLNSRTLLMNPVLRFLYMNMNYHCEHHMYPMVPYHALPRLHEVVKHDCPIPDPNLFHTWARIIPALLRQLREPGYFIERQLPPGAGRLSDAKVAAE